MRRRLARAAYFGRLLPRSAWQHLLAHLLLALSRRVVIRGVDVRMRPDRHDTGDVARAIEAALDLIATTDARHLRRLRRDVATVLVLRHCGPEFWTLTRTCVIPESAIARRNAAMLALSLVHEGAHARITAASVYPSDVLSLRMERRCVREQLEFALRLKAAGWGDIDPLIEHLRRDPAEHPWWTTEALAARRMAMLEEAGVPRWLRRVLARV